MSFTRDFPFSPYFHFFDKTNLFVWDAYYGIFFKKWTEIIVNKSNDRTRKHIKEALFECLLKWINCEIFLNVTYNNSLLFQKPLVIASIIYIHYIWRIHFWIFFHSMMHSFTIFHSSLLFSLSHSFTLTVGYLLFRCKSVTSSLYKMFLATS